MKNFFLRILVNALKLFLPTHTPNHRILIVSTTALGDTLWATPAIENIRLTFPHSHIAVLTSPIGLQILQNNPHINTLYLWQKNLSLWSLWKKLYFQKFDTILIFHASQRLVFPFCASLGATRIIGTDGINKGLDDWLTENLPQKEEHEIVRRLKMAEKIGAKIEKETLSFYLTKEEILPPRKKGIWIALHPGSKDGYKRWPHFGKLGQRLKEKFNCEILITGSEAERALLQEVAEQIEGAQIYMSPSLRSFAATLQQMDLIVTNDTGPFHLGLALERPTLGIYCSTDPKLCGPYKAKTGIVVSKMKTCNPCLKRKCLDPFCFQQIGVDEVVDIVMMPRGMLFAGSGLELQSEPGLELQLNSTRSAIYYNPIC